MAGGGFDLLEERRNTDLVLTTVTVASCRASLILILTLAFLDIDLLLLAVGYMYNNNAALIAGNSLGFVVSFLSCKYCPDPCGVT